LLLAGLVTALVFAALASAARAADQVYWGNYNGTTISFANLNGTGGGGDLPTGTATVNNAYGIAIDSAAGRLYWANFGGDAISVANLDGSGGHDLTISGATVSGPSGIAINPAVGRIYWANGNNSTISFAKLDGSGGGDLDTTGATVNSPDGVAIDPATGRIYWANAAGTAQISFANLNDTGGGGDLDLTGVPAASNPIGPAIDPVGGRIYWANQSGLIAFANLNDTGGGGSLDQTGASVNSPQGVAIDPAAGRVYWANFLSAPISFANLDNTGGGADLDTTGATVDGATFPTLLRAPISTAPPTITGNPTVGSTISCSQGSWAPDLLGSNLYRAPQSFSYIWSLDGTQVPGATSSSLSPSAAGSYTCRVTAQNHAGSAASQTSAPIAVSSVAAAGPGATCVVPKLKGKKLKADKKRLRNANCKLGKVKGPKGGRVKKQSPKAGTVLPVGSTVNVKLS
jgi:DNA-binding beta-propeller fold protein YncE